MSSIKKNYFYQLCYQILISILPFITSPYIARVLGAKNIGIYSYTFSIISFFDMFAALGIVNYGNRSIAKVKKNQNELNKTFSSIFFFHAIFTLTTIIIYLIYCRFFVTENKLIALVQTIYLISELFDINWFYFGIEKFKLTVIRNAIIKLLTVIAIFIFVRNRADLWKYTFILAFGTFISTSAVWLFLPKYAKFVRFSVRDIVKHIKPMFVLFFAATAITVYSYMDKIMIGLLNTLSELGYYENAMKIIVFPSGFVTAVGTVMLPKISYLTAKDDSENIKNYIYKSIKFVSITSIAIAFGVAGIAKEFSVVFWGSDFAKSGQIILVLAVTIVLTSFNYVVRVEYFIPKELDKIYLFAVSSAAVVNGVVNWLLIPKYGSIGAAIGTIIAHLTIFIIQNYHASKEYHIYKQICYAIPYIIIGLLMFIFVRIIGNLMGYKVITLFVEVIVGAVIFIVLTTLYSFLFKDRFIIEQFVHIKNIVRRNSK